MHINRDHEWQGGEEAPHYLDLQGHNLPEHEGTLSQGYSVILKDYGYYTVCCFRVIFPQKNFSQTTQDAGIHSAIHDFIVPDSSK